MHCLFRMPGRNAGHSPAAAHAIRTRRWAAGAGLIALMWSCAAPAADPQPPGATVESLLAFARQHNPDYQASRLDAAAAEERVYPAGALPDPKFRNEFRDITKMDTQNPTLLPARVGNNRYLLTQDVPWFGKRDIKRAVAQSNADAAQGVARGTWADIAARITASFAQLYYVDRTTRLAREILDLMDRLEKIAQVRYANGLAAQQDVVRAQVEQTSTRNELVALDGERQRLQASLNGLLARPANAPLAEPQHLPPLPASSKLDRAAIEARVREHNPQLFADAARVRAAEQSRELAYKNRYPDFTLGVSPIQYGGAVKEWEVMVEINIPLQQKTRRSQEREAEAMLSAARARRQATANEVLAQLAADLAAIETARRTEALAGKSLLPQAEVTFQAALAGYETGKVDFATLLDAQRQIRQAKQSTLKARFEAQAGVADIEKLLGEPL